MALVASGMLASACEDAWGPLALSAKQLQCSSCSCTARSCSLSCLGQLCRLAFLSKSAGEASAPAQKVGACSQGCRVREERHCASAWVVCAAGSTEVSNCLHKAKILLRGRGLEVKRLRCKTEDIAAVVLCSTTFLLPSCQIQV